MSGHATTTRVRALRCFFGLHKWWRYGADYHWRECRWCGRRKNDPGRRLGHG